MITKDMTFGDILKKCPQAAGVMMKYGLHCIGCHIATIETLEQGCAAHGISPEEMKKLINEINKLEVKKDG